MSHSNAPSPKTKGARGRSTPVIAAPEAVLLPPKVLPPVRLEYAGYARDLVKGMVVSAEYMPFADGQSPQMAREHCERMVRVIASLRVIAMVYEDGLRPNPRHLSTVRTWMILCDQCAREMNGAMRPKVRATEPTLRARREYRLSLDEPDREVLALLDRPNIATPAHFWSILRNLGNASEALEAHTRSIGQGPLADELQEFVGNVLFRPYPLADPPDGCTEMPPVDRIEILSYMETVLDAVEQEPEDDEDAGDEADAGSWSSCDEGDLPDLLAAAC